MPFMPRTTRNRARRRRIAYATRKPYYIPKGVATRRAPKRKYKGPKPSKTFVENMKKYNNNNLEKKIIPMKNYLNGPGSQGYLQDLPAQGLLLLVLLMTLYLLLYYKQVVFSPI